MGSLHGVYVADGLPYPDLMFRARILRKQRPLSLALLLAFGSAITWHEDFHLARSVPCLAHTPCVSRARLRASAGRNG